LPTRTGAPASQPLDLAQRRTLGVLLSDGVRIYLRQFARLMAIGAAVVVPAELIVSGAGLGDLTSGYDSGRPLLATLVPQLVQALVTTPLIVAMVVHVLRDLSAPRAPSARRAIQSGLDVFAAAFLPVLAAVACELLIAGAAVLLALAVNPGFFVLLALPAVLAVRWYLVAQSVVVAGERRLGALRASWELTQGAGLRVFAVAIVAYLGFTWAAAVFGAPVLAAAKAADSGPLVLVARILMETLATPGVAVVGALLYFDLRARRA
jgi:hypothetical protein